MKYIPELDGLRALSALLIVLHHSGAPGVVGGFFAVDVFFVLSGFLVTQILWLPSREKGCVAWFEFIHRRLLRLLPALVVMLVAYVSFSPFMWSAQFSLVDHIRDAIFTITYTVNWLQTWGREVVVLGHVWSLAVEMQFYLMWPLVVLLVFRLPKKIGLWAFFALYVLATLWRVYGSFYLETPWSVYTRTDMHASGLVLGAVLALLPNARVQWLALPGLLLLFFCVTFFSTHWNPTVLYGFTLAELGAAMLIVSRPAWLATPFLVWIGQISYGLYLWHYPIVLYFQLQGLPWVQVFFYGVTIALVLASLSYYYVESRFYSPIRKRESSAGKGC